MTDFRIPKAFTMFGQRIQVQFVEDLIDVTDCVGMARLRKNVIEIQPGTGPQIFRPRAQTEQTFFHELIHWALDLLCEDELSKDEKLVDKLGSMLHQAFTTMEYDEKPAERVVDYARIMGS